MPGYVLFNGDTFNRPAANGIRQGKWIDYEMRERQTICTSEVSDCGLRKFKKGGKIDKVLDGEDAGFHSSGSYCDTSFEIVMLGVGYYENGLRQGVWRNYYAPDKPKWQCNYVHGKVEGEKLYYTHEGYVLFSATYNSDQLNGAFKIFTPSGKLDLLAEVHDENETAEFTKFNNAGQKIDSYHWRVEDVIEAYLPQYWD
jgi:hypothetical protein